MQSLTSLLVPAVGVAFGAAFLLALVGAKVARARTRRRRRVVEQPNSHYDAPLKKDVETRHRWQEIDLSRIHEINRDEVRRLLARVEAAGMDSLRPREREFLDQVARIAR